MLGVLFNSIGLQVITPTTWPLAVRFLVITSSTAQNFQTDANIGADAEVTHGGIPIARDVARI
jgi:hypothetical protein